MKSTEVTIKVQLDRFLQLWHGCKVLCFAHGNIIDNWANSLHVGNGLEDEFIRRIFGVLVSFNDLFIKYVLPRSSWPHSKACHAIFSILYSFSLINGLTGSDWPRSNNSHLSRNFPCKHRSVCLRLFVSPTVPGVLSFVLCACKYYWPNSLHVRNVQGTQMRTGVIHFVSEMLRGTQMTTVVIHFMSEMLRGTQMTTGVIHFVSEILRGTQVTTGVIHFVSEILRGTQMTTEVIHFVSKMLRVRKASQLFWNWARRT